MTKFIVGMLISAVVIFCLLTGGTAALIASYYLWFATGVISLACLFMMIGIVIVKFLNVNVSKNFKGYNKNQLFLLHPFTRIATFTVSMLTAFIAYKVGYETLAIYYGIVAFVGQVLTGVCIGMVKGK